MSHPYRKTPRSFTLAASSVVLAMAMGCTEEVASVSFIDVRAEEIGSSRAVIRFQTSRPTSCEVEYGTERDALTLRATDPSMDDDELDIDHEVALEDLQPDTTYFYRGYTVDADGQVFRSAIESFVTLASGVDADLRNVALLEEGAAVVQVSSNFGGAENDETWGANAAFDGLMSTEWATNGDGDDASVTIDLGQPRTLSAFGFRSRKMADGSSIIRSVQLIVDENTILGPYETPDPDGFYRFEIDPQVEATLVRIEAVTTSGGNSGAKEIQLFVPSN